MGEVLEVSRQRERAGAKRVPETGDDLAAKDATQDLHRQEEGRARVHPPRAVARETARGHDAVHVRMMQQRLAPRVEDAEKAECGAEVLRRAGDLEERRRTRLEEQVVDDAFVLQGQPGEGVRQGEDDVGVPDRQQLALALGEPLVARVRQALRAVPIATRVERDGAMAAGGTAIEMPAQAPRCGSARWRGAHADAARSARRDGSR